MTAQAAIKRVFGSKCPVHQIDCYKPACSEKCNAITTSTSAQPAVITQPTRVTPQCHTGMIPIGLAGKMRMWAGRQASCMNHGIEGRPWSLVISLLGPDKYFETEEFIGGNEAARALIPAGLFVKHPPVPFMHIDWPDYDAPHNLDRAWWTEFLCSLVKIDGDVAVFCQGGHGRTGTFLSIMAGACGWSGDTDPVQWVRDIYCKEAVESVKQIKYIERILGRDIKALAVEAEWEFGPAGSHQGSFWERYEAMERRKLEGKNVEPIKGDPNEPTLSKAQYKKWAKQERKLGRHAPPLGLLEDGAEVEFDGSIFMFSKVDNCFEWLGELA